MKRSLLGVFGLYLSIFITGQVWADGFNLIPSIALRQEYNDNIFFTESAEIDDFITTVSPGLEIEQRTERLDARVSGRVDGLLYFDHDELNDLDQNYAGRVEYQFTPRMRGSVDASYLRDSRADRDIDISGLVLGTDIRRRQHLGAAGNYALSEKAAIGTSYAYDKEEFDDVTDSDYNSHNVGLGLTYNLEALWQATIGRMNFGYVNVGYTNASVANYSLTFGIERALTEVYRLLVDFGPRFTRTEFDDSAIEDSEVWGVRGNIILSYRGEYMDMSLNFLHDVQPASGRAGSTERTGMTATVGYRFSDKFRAALSASYFMNRSERQEFALSDIEENSFRIQPRLRYEFTRDMALETFYSYTLIEDEEAATEREQNLIFIRFEWRYPLLES